jgi:hypothetical protein
MNLNGEYVDKLTDDNYKCLDRTAPKCRISGLDLCINNVGKIGSK